MSLEPLAEHDHTSIVLVGSFNPRIFHPAWFVRHGLLAPEAEADSKIEVISNDLCVMQAGWFRIEVFSERFTMHSVATPVTEALRDLVQATFAILRHTPITRIGLNRAAHFNLGSEGAWHNFGHRLAPKKTLWEPVLKQPGTLSLTIMSERPDDYDGHINVKVEPSARVRYGLFVEVNEEYRPVSTSDANDAVWISDVLVKQWDDTQRRAAQVFKHVVSQASEGSK